MNGNEGRTMEPLHLCIMGHSGAGKSHLSKLFPIPGWDPYRVRQPRDKNDKAMSKEEFDALLKNGEVAGKERGQLVWPCSDNKEDAVDGNLIRQTYEDTGRCVCEHWSFFKVRTDDQCLEHADFKRAESMRIEIFAPAFLKMVNDSLSLPETVRLERQNLLVVILNPTRVSFSTMQEPSQELCLATLMAIMERKRAKGDVPDLADALKRVNYLNDELPAWRSFLKMDDVATLECLNWPHFEYRYCIDPQAELERARRSLFKAVRSMIKEQTWTAEQGEAWAGRLELQCMLSEETSQ